MLRWYGHVKRREETYVGQRMLVLPGKRRRGRPQRQNVDNIRADMKELSAKETYTQDKRRWNALPRFGGSDYLR